MSVADKEIVKGLLDEESKWILNETKLSSCDEWVKLTLPVKDRHGKYLVMFARIEGRDVVLSDGGYAMEEMADAGNDVNSRSVSGEVSYILDGTGCDLVDGQIMTRVKKSDFGIGKFQLLRGVASVEALANI